MPDKLSGAMAAARPVGSTMTLHPDLVLRFLARPLQQPGTAELAHHSAAALFCSDSEFRVGHILCLNSCFGRVAAFRSTQRLWRILSAVRLPKLCAAIPLQRTSGGELLWVEAAGWPARLLPRVSYGHATSDQPFAS